MQKLLLTCIAVFFLLKIDAQDYPNQPVIITPGESLKSARDLVRILEKDQDGGLYIMKQKGAYSPFPEIHYYDKNLKIKKVIPVKQKDEKFGLLRGVLDLGEKVLIFSTNRPVKENKIIFRVHVLRKSDFVKEKTLIIGDTSNTQGGHTVAFSYDHATPTASSSNYRINPLHLFANNIFVSEDKSKLFIISQSRIDPDHPRRTEQFLFKVLDLKNDFKEIFSRKINFPIKRKKFELIDAVVDNHGNAYLAALHKFDLNIARKAGKPNYEYKLYKLTADSVNHDFESNIELSDKFVSNIQLKLSPNGSLFCAAYFANGTTININKGIYYAFVDTISGKVKQEKYLAFDKEELEGGRKKVVDHVRLGRLELENLALKNIFIGDDGAIWLVGEQNFSSLLGSGAGSTISSNEELHHITDIIIVKLNAKGEKSWVKLIDKNQYFKKAIYTSFIPHFDGNSLKLFYNDSYSNMKDRPAQKFKSMMLGNPYITMVAVSKEGKVKKYLSVKSKINGFYSTMSITGGYHKEAPFGRAGIQVDDKSIILLSKKKGSLTFQPVKITLK